MKLIHKLTHAYYLSPNSHNYVNHVSVCGSWQKAKQQVEIYVINFKRKDMSIISTKYSFIFTSPSIYGPKTHSPFFLNDLDLFTLMEHWDHTLLSVGFLLLSFWFSLLHFVIVQLVFKSLFYMTPTFFSLYYVLAMPVSSSEDIFSFKDILVSRQ